MSKKSRSEEDDWKKVWEARLAALVKILGPESGSVLHAPVPFYLGGFADVIPFPSYVPGMTYVTADLADVDTGQLPSSLGNYELMACAKSELPAAADLISKLARYTCDAELEPGQTMDIPDKFFGDKTLRAVLFAHPAVPPVPLEFLGQKYGLLLCVGITGDELAYSRAKGTAKLLAALKLHKVFPYTVPDRKSVILPD